MTNPFLVPNYLKTDKLEHRATRDGYGEGLVEAGKKDPRVVVLCADLTDSTRSTAFKQAFPDRFIQMGIFEQAMTSIAAGLSMAGKIPFIASYAMFCPGRSWEQVRTNLCLNETKVIIAGAHSGVSVGPDGATHQAIEDIALMRVLPNMTVIAPSDSVETKKATLAALDVPGPVYLRFTREKTPIFTTTKTPFKVGQAEVYRDGKDVAIIACGPLLHQALLAAEELKKHRIQARVINCHTIKPLDQKTIAEAAKECGAIVTVEEHQRIGGLGGAVAELLATTYPVPMEFIGVDDQFGESGTPDELLEHFHLTAPWIVRAAVKAINRKKG
ncbi:MAG: transketolase family protein [bacterium]